MKDSCELGPSVRLLRHDWKNMLIFVLSGIVFLFFMQLRERTSFYLVLDTTAADVQSPVTTARSSSHHLKFRPAIDEDSLYDEEFIIHENEFTSTTSPNNEPEERSTETTTTTTVSTSTSTGMSTVIDKDNEDCPVRDTAEWNEKVEPIYKLSKDEFLYTVGVAGPNNQLISLREMVFTAVKLNRTIVISPFFKHDIADPSSQGDGVALVDPYLRINIQKLRELVPVLSREEHKSACPHFDAIYDVGNMCKAETVKRFKASCLFFGHEFCKNRKGEEIFKHGCSNKSQQDDGIVQKTLTYDKPDYTPRGADSYDEKCAVLAFPYNLVNFWSAAKKKGEDHELVKQIVAHTGRPPFVVDLAQAFAKQELNGDYITLHWRYNSGDWLHGICDKSGNTKEKLSEICTQISMMKKPEVFASQISSFIDTIPGVNSIYIASPPSETEMLNKGRQFLAKTRPDIKVVLQSELIPFLHEKFFIEGCKEHENESWDLLSLAEMEVAAESRIFLSSIGSSWSNNIKMERQLREISADDEGNKVLLPAV